ncbi:MAG: hypothetical protein R3E96_09645 [Planctomycetota bacterium]
MKSFEGIEIVGLQPNVKTFAIKHDRTRSRSKPRSGHQCHRGSGDGQVTATWIQ